MIHALVRCRVSIRIMWDYIDGRLSDARGAP